GNMAYDYLGIFHDTHMPPLPYQVRATDYQANIRIFPDVTTPDVNSGPGPYNGFAGMLPLRQVGSIKNASEVMMIWCGSVDISDGATNKGCDPESHQIDSSVINFGYCMMYPNWPASQSWFNPSIYSKPIAPGQDGTGAWSGNNVTKAQM